MDSPTANQKSRPRITSHTLSKIYFIEDVIKSDGNLLKFDEFKQTYTSVRTNFVEYLGLKMAIEAFIKNCNVEHASVKLFHIELPFLYKLIFRNLKGCKEFYNIFISNRKITIQSQDKWNTEYERTLQL